MEPTLLTAICVTQVAFIMASGIVHQVVFVWGDFHDCEPPIDAMPWMFVASPFPCSRFVTKLEPIPL